MVRSSFTLAFEMVESKMSAKVSPNSISNNTLLRDAVNVVVYRLDVVCICLSTASSPL